VLQVELVSMVIAACFIGPACCMPDIWCGEVPSKQVNVTADAARSLINVKGLNLMAVLRNSACLPIIRLADLSPDTAVA